VTVKNIQSTWWSSKKTKCIGRTKAKCTFHFVG